MRRDFKDIDFVVVANPEEYSVDFKIFRILGEEEGGTLVFHNGDERYTVPTSNIEEAEVFANGFVKWDGCSNWGFSKNCMIHACSREMLEDIGAVLARCWDMAAELCPNWSA